MNFYQSLGPLILGSRLRRISEYFIAELNKVYQEQKIAFDASWFPVFYILAQQHPVTLRDIADRLQISHSAVSQLISNLKRRQLVETEVSDEDARRQLVRLTRDGNELLAQVTPIWTSIAVAMSQMGNQNAAISSLLPNITAIEQAFLQKGLSERIMESITTHAV